MAARTTGSSLASRDPACEGRGVLRASRRDLCSGSSSFGPRSWRPRGIALVLAWLAALDFSMPHALGADGVAVAPAAVASALSGASLEDSREHRWNLAEIASHPVLLILAGRKGSDQAVAWGEGIHRRHPDGLALWAKPADPRAVVVVSDADLHEVPGFLRGLVRWRIAAVVADRERSGRQGPPLLLDWEGAVPRAVGADTSGDAVVVLLAADRVERARFSGQPTEDSLGRLAAAIDAVRGRPVVSAEPCPCMRSTPEMRTPLPICTGASVSLLCASAMRPSRTVS